MKLVSSHYLVNRIKRRKKRPILPVFTNYDPVPQRSHTGNGWMSKVATHLHCFTSIQLVNVNIVAGIRLGEPGVMPLPAAPAAELKCMIPCFIHLLFVSQNQIWSRGNICHRLLLLFMKDQGCVPQLRETHPVGCSEACLQMHFLCFSLRALLLELTVLCLLFHPD